MKKKYIIPQTKVTNVALQQMIAASLTAGNTTGNITSEAKDQLDFDMDDVLKDWEW